MIDPILGKIIETRESLLIYPKTFFSTPQDILEESVQGIERELEERIESFRRRGQLLEAERIEERICASVPASGVGASTGVTWCDATRDDLADMLRRADADMYRNKRASSHGGRSCQDAGVRGDAVAVAPQTSL